MGNQLQDALKAAGLVGAKGENSKKSGRELNGRRASATNFPIAVQAVARQPTRNAPADPVRQKQGNDRPADQKQVAQMAKTEIKTGSTGSQNATAPSEPSKPMKPSIRFIKSGDFRPHPLFASDEYEDIALPEMGHTGIENQLSDEPQNASDMIIGLDFGTSATKVVIRDSFGAKVFPVKLNGGRAGVEGYLLASRVYLDGDAYSLEAGGQKLDDLKLALLACKSALPVTEFNNCCAFLALIIRRARGWLFSEYHEIYRSHELEWCLNIGLAARSYHDEAKVAVFKRLAWAASNLAADADVMQITKEAVDRYRKLSQQAFGNDVPDETSSMEFAPDDIGVVPEVSAQIKGFMSSARWDWNSRPIMMLVDVGAGTVDSALFHVKPTKDSKGVLTFYSSRVEPNGAMNLHRARVSWLLPAVPQTQEFEPVRAYLESIAKPTGRLKPIPENDVDYLQGYKVEKSLPGADEDFKLNKYRRQVAGSINEAKVKKGIGAKGSQQLRQIPLLLCGGGSRMFIYSSIASEINSTSGWGDVSVEVTRMPVPIELKDTGWHVEDFDRISVAYGLCLNEGLEGIVRDIEVPDVTPPKRDDDGNSFISKDQM